MAVVTGMVKINNGAKGVARMYFNIRFVFTVREIKNKDCEGNWLKIMNFDRPDFPFPHWGLFM